jgi:hypothetical protein
MVVGDGMDLFIGFNHLEHRYDIEVNGPAFWLQRAEDDYEPKMFYFDNKSVDVVPTAITITPQNLVNVTFYPMLVLMRNAVLSYTRLSDVRRFNLLNAIIELDD